MKRVAYVLLVVPVMLVLFLPADVFAQAPFVLCQGPDDCGTCEFITTLNRTIRFMIGLAAIIGTIALVFAGLKMVTSGGSEAAKTQAKQTLWFIVMGLFFMIAAYAIINLIIISLVPEDSPLRNWTEFDTCIYPTPSQEPGASTLSGSRGLSEGAVLSNECTELEDGTHDCSQQIADCEDGEGTATVNNGGSVPTVDCRYSATAYTGSCDAPTDESNPCHVSNMSGFGARAEEASRICMKESGGAPVKSGSDLCCGPGGDCSGAPSFSGGYFQINVLANGSRVPGCDTSSMYQKNCIAGERCQAEGSCVRRNGRGVCTGWSCSITDTSMYNTCMKVTTDSALNFQIAQDLFNAGGQSFGPWSWSANFCEIPTR